MIENVHQLKEAARQAGALIQQMSDFVQKHPRYAEHGQVRFPRGHIKSAVNIRLNLRFIENDNLRRNVSYALMTHEVYLWLVFHTDLAGQAQEMMIKEAVCLLGNICESITIFPKEHGLGRRAGFRGRVARLCEMEVIDDETVELLEWLWGKRNQEHLIDVQFREWSHYEINDWYRSVRAYLSLRDGLLRWRGFEPVEARGLR